MCVTGFGSGQCLPGPTFEFGGSVNSDMGRVFQLVGSFCRREALDVVREWIETHRAVGEGDVPVVVLPRDGVLEPVHIVALLVILAGVGASGFRAGVGGMGDDNGLVG